MPTFTPCMHCDYPASLPDTWVCRNCHTKNDSTLARKVEAITMLVMAGFDIADTEEQPLCYSDAKTKVRKLVAVALLGQECDQETYRIGDYLRPELNQTIRDIVLMLK